MTPNPQSCVPPGHVRARRSVVAALLVAAVGTSGCKMMTEAQLQVRQQEQARLERKSASEEKNAARLQEVDQAQQQLTLRIQDRDARRDRMGRFEEARRAFDGGDPAGAIAIVDDVFAADQESIALYEAARAEGNTIEFLSTVELVEDEKATADPVTGEKPTIEKLVVTPTPMTDEDEAMFYVLRGGAHYTSGNREQGLADFRTATELDPGNRVARINLGKLLFEQHEWEGALAAWKTELEDGYRSAELLELIGQALFELAKEKDDPSLIEASRQALMEAFVATPQKESLVRWLGRLEYYCERYEEAIRYFEGVLARHPLDPTYLEYLANAQLELDRYREAADTFELLVRVSEGEDLQRVQLSLVGLYAQLRLPDRAEESRRVGSRRARLYPRAASRLPELHAERRTIPRGGDPGHPLRSVPRSERTRHHSERSDAREPRLRRRPGVERPAVDRALQPDHRAVRPRGDDDLRRPLGPGEVGVPLRERRAPRAGGVPRPLLQRPAPQRHRPGDRLPPGGDRGGPPRALLAGCDRADSSHRGRRTSLRWFDRVDP